MPFLDGPRRSPATTRPYRVVAACDLAPQGEAALERAAALAEQFDGELHAVLVQDPAKFLPSSRPYASGGLLDRLRLLTDRAVRMHPRISAATAHLLLGETPNELAWICAHLDADMLVVGSHERGAAARFFLGSVAERVMRIAGCAVLIHRVRDHSRVAYMALADTMCPRCEAHRKSSRGAELWCAMHVNRHMRMDVGARTSEGSTAAADVSRS